VTEGSEDRRPDEKSEEIPSASTDVAAEGSAIDQTEGPVPPLSPTRTFPLFTSDAALRFAETRSMTGRRGATLALLMGEVKSGKTTLLAELWNWLLSRGTLGGHTIAGSRTALAFEQRAYYSRVASAAEEAFTIHTPEEEDGLLHLRVARPGGERVELFFADYAGEHFRRIREGVPLVRELPWVSRVDRFLVLVDGRQFAIPGNREVAVTRARRQLHALGVSEAVVGTARIAIVLTKADVLPEPEREAFRRIAPSLLELARPMDSEAVVLEVAARPSHGAQAEGLDDLLAFVARPDRTSARPDEQHPIPSRLIARFRA